MFFLNEKLIAAFLSIFAFFVAMVTSFVYKVGLQAALMRGLIAAFIFMFVGIIFGNAIKGLIVEAFAAKEKEEAAAKTQADGSSKKEENTTTVSGSEGTAPPL